MAKALPSHLLNEWDHQKNHDVDPSTISGGSGRSFYWVCSLGHSWKAVVNYLDAEDVEASFDV